MKFEGSNSFPKPPESGQIKEASELKVGDYLPAYESAIKEITFGGSQQKKLLLENGIEALVDYSEEFEVK